MRWREFLVVLCSSLSFGQGSHKNSPLPANISELDKAIVVWHDRAEQFTNAMLEDQWQLGAMQPVLDARLADAWWKYDPPRAHVWLNGAIKYVLGAWANEPEQVHKERLNAAQTIFTIVDRHDHKAANQILGFIIEGTKTDAKNRLRLPFETQSTIETAAEQSIEAGDSQRAEHLGDQLIQFQDPGRRIGNLLASIAAKNHAEGDRYYVSALSAAAASNDFNSVSDLLLYILSNSSEPPSAYSPLIQQTVDIVEPMLTQVPQTDEQETTYCEGAPLVMTWMRPILPASARGQVDAALLTCRNKGIRPPGDWRQGCESVAECLELASGTSDPKKSADWKWDAAGESEHEGDVSNAVDILLSYTPEEKEAFGAMGERLSPLLRNCLTAALSS